MHEAIMAQPKMVQNGRAMTISSGVRVSRWMCLRTVVDADHYIEPLRLQQSEDFQESTQASLEKRQPRYPGR
jgi:hypothetical protein